MEGYIVDYNLLDLLKESGLEERPKIVFDYFNQLISNCVTEQLKYLRRANFTILVSGEWKQTHERLEDWETYVRLTPDIMAKLLEAVPTRVLSRRVYMVEIYVEDVRYDVGHHERRNKADRHISVGRCRYRTGPESKNGGFKRASGT